ncbi:MAG: 1-deoxy-D-xylulose-5-phosphate reductoisomerase [Ilumatobacteraceae bacterium]|nr:1-deoxy-D-xylulose-5-phosphate reductoisomerase [Ilumatobacteraceae bacterium]
MTRVAIAGSTGSIGKQTLEVIAASESGKYQLVALSANSSADEIIKQAKTFKPNLVVVNDESARKIVARELAATNPKIEVIADVAAMAGIADVVVNGVVGFAGLSVTIATLAAGKRLALANKESLIAAGPVVAPLRKISGAEIIPVDSEHCAIHQCLRSSQNNLRDVAKLLLTASGGPFRGQTKKSLEEVTIKDALKHPTWSMGPKITVDSSTLMNKGLEVIEAHELFGLDYDSIDVVVHPQSIVHSMVEFRDGATIAQLSLPDMRLPIAYALDYPNRSTVGFGAIDWTKLSRLDFEQPDRDTFRCLNLAYAAGRIGGTAPAWLSAANEVAVEAFLAGVVQWSQIASIIESTMQHHDGLIATEVEDILEADAVARQWARKEVSR